MLPATGTFAALGDMIEKGFKLAIDEQGGKLGGREIQYFKVDDESDPSKATDNVNKLIKRDQVDVIIGTVHSGVALGMAKAAKDKNLDAATSAYTELAKNCVACHKYVRLVNK
jgi:branched-chain amino acid transport system substrate-binding protein